MTQRREDILVCTDTPLHPYEQVIRAVHTDPRQGTKEYHRWLYQVSHYTDGSFCAFTVETYTRKTVPYPYECHCGDVYDEWIQDERTCCYCLDYDEPPEPSCLCVTGDDWEVIEKTMAIVAKEDTGNIIYRAYPSKFIPVWVIDHIQKGLTERGLS